jgi:peptide methionine sulfoxide reductase MsrA
LSIAKKKLNAEESKLEMNKSKFGGKIVTEITKASTFYSAEQYHQHYNKKMKEKYGIG